ncbi:DUF1810 family protein, partial [Klebsiella pneumoniae]|uniref:DUF1810 family protein n=1 Tax=Klebsiella pneumoniae TaxID=573 RepID=UPI0037218270
MCADHPQITRWPVPRRAVAPEFQNRSGCLPQDDGPTGTRTSPHRFPLAFPGAIVPTTCTHRLRVPLRPRNPSSSNDRHRAARLYEFVSPTSRKSCPVMDDPYALQRFVDAQEPVYGQVLAELRAGAKRTHWMWFVFPQLAGLG